MISFAYVVFDSVDSATKAVQALDHQVYEGRRITVQYASSPGNAEGQLKDPSKTLFVGNMSFEMSDADLNTLFKDIRNVIDVRVAVDRTTGTPRGFAHADFVDIQSAVDALEILKTKAPYGRKLRVDYSSNLKDKRVPNKPTESASGNSRDD